MHSRREYLALAGELAIVAGLVWLVRPGAPVFGVDEAAPAIAFFLAIYVLDLFEVQLPRGDFVGMSTAVVAAAVPFMLPPNLFWIAIVPTGLAQLSRMRRGDLGIRLDAILRRAALALFAIAYAETLTDAGVDIRALVGALVLVAGISLADFILAQLQTAARTGSPLLPLVTGGLGLQGSIVAGNVSSGALAILVYPVMGVWSTAVLVLILLVMRQSFSMLVSVRAAYQSTIEALARTVEVRHPGKLGHSNRVSSLAAEAGRLYGLRGHDLERLAYAGLLHDLGDDEDDIPEDASLMEGIEVHTATDLLAEVNFLNDVVPILRLREVPPNELGAADEPDLRMAYLVLAASAMDDGTRGAMTPDDRARIADLGSVLSTEDQGRLDSALQEARRRAIARYAQDPLLAGRG